MHNTITLPLVEDGDRVIEFGDEAFDRGLYVVVGGTADLTFEYE